MTNQKLVEGKDYIIEEGYYVFTRQYLLARDYCCESGCRNCPYESSNKTADRG